MTSIVRIVATVVALLALTPAGASMPKRAAPPMSRDWSQVAARTPDGTFLLGNPAAKVKLVEYLSFTCPHCAVFEREAVPKLIDKYVRTGRVSYEVRVALLNGFDLAAAMLARCDGPKRFFALKPIVYAAQPRWVAQAETWAATAPDVAKMSEADAGRAMMRGAGLDALLARSGMPPARAAQCMANVADQKLLSSKAQGYWALPGFPGTPAFAVNGALNPGIHDWAALDAALAAALR